MKDYLKQNDVKIKGGSDVNAIIKDMMSVILGGTLDEELSYSKYDYRNKDTVNSWNGHLQKTIYTSDGDIGAWYSQRPEWGFWTADNQEIAEHSHAGHGGKIISMYARGMATNDNESHMRIFCGINISDSTP